MTKNAYILFYRRIDEHKSANIEVSSTNAESGSAKDNKDEVSSTNDNEDNEGKK